MKKGGCFGNTKMKENSVISKLPPMTCEIAYNLGLAVEAGCTEEDQRVTFGDATVNWINKVQKSKKFKRFCKANWD